MVGVTLFVPVRATVGKGDQAAPCTGTSLDSSKSTKLKSNHNTRFRVIYPKIQTLNGASNPVLKDVFHPLDRKV